MKKTMFWILFLLFVDLPKRGRGFWYFLSGLRIHYACLPSMRSQIWVIAGSLLAGWPGCYINIYSIVRGATTEEFLDNSFKEKGISSQFRVSISSWYNLSCWKVLKKIHPFPIAGLPKVQQYQLDWPTWTYLTDSFMWSHLFCSWLPLAGLMWTNLTSVAISRCTQMSTCPVGEISFLTSSPCSCDLLWAFHTSNGRFHSFVHTDPGGLMAVWSKALPLTAICLSPLGPALMAVWSKALPLTAICLSPLRICPDGRVV